MKRILVFTIAAVAALVVAQDKVKIQPKYTAESSSSYKITMKMAVGGIEAELSGNMVMAVKSAGEAEAKVEYDWQNGKAVVNGEETPVPFAPTHVIYDLKGDLMKVEGGIEGTDPIRTYLTVFAHLPADELVKDGTWKKTYPKSAPLGIEERTVEGTYLGDEEVSGKKSHKFKIKMVEGGTFTTVITAWVEADGKIVKLEGEFTALPLPIAGENANGTVRLELVTK